MLNRIAWSRIALTFKLPTYAKINLLKNNCFDHKTTYLCLIELFEIELFYI